MAGNTRWAPSELVPAAGLVRDGDLGTIGGGNHFVEIQAVVEIRNPRLAYQSNVKVGQLAIAIHSGSRSVGKYIGGMWRDRAKSAWLKGYPFPQSSLFSLSTATHPDLVAEYLAAEATAANYAFVNRLILAELLRLRLRQVYGDLAAPLVCDIPHNLTFPNGDGWIVRKGACAAAAGQLLITPGSMGTPSYLLSGLGNDRYLNSAAHGAGRAISRFELAPGWTKSIAIPIPRSIDFRLLESVAEYFANLLMYWFDRLITSHPVSRVIDRSILLLILTDGWQ